MLNRNEETVLSIFNRIYLDNKALHKTEFKLIEFSLRQTSKLLGKNDMDVMRELKESIIFPNQMNNIIFDHLGNIKHYSMSAITDIDNTLDSDSRVYTVK